ncbi:MAG TPA: hypothetical protein PKX92_06150 [Edaphocola sp.]|nr:hypothetical protein [Edaphocola sp.]
MKKIIVSSVLLGWIAFGIACSPKKAKVEAGMTKAMALANYSPDQIAKGEAIFNEKCGKCHRLFQPVEFKANKWHGILDAMIPKAKLSKEDGDLVRAFVIANTK